MYAMSPWDMEWDDVVTAVTIQVRVAAAQALPQEIDAEWWETEQGEKLRSELDLMVAQQMDLLQMCAVQMGKQVKRS